MALEKIRGIVVSTVKHNDRHNVVTLYTRERGRMAFISSVGKSSKGRGRNARLLPLSVIDTEVNIKGNEDLYLLGAVAPAEIWHDLYFNPVKSAIALFLSEFLNRYLREMTQDTATWNFIINSLRALDSSVKGLSNFHIWFLIRFLEIAGISPDLSELEDGDWFDMRAGMVVAEAPPHQDSLTPADTSRLAILCRISLKNLHKFRFSGNERRVILDRLLQYYAVHFPGLSSLKSLDILSEVFG